MSQNYRVSGSKVISLLKIGERQVVIGRTPFRIGRDPRAGLAINHPSIDRLHCRIDRTADGFQLRRLSSGTLRVNGRAVDEYLLYPGDVLQVGLVQMSFRSGRLRRPEGSSRVRARRSAPRARRNPLNIALTTSVLFFMFSLGMLYVSDREPQPPSRHRGEASISLERPALRPERTQKRPSRQRKSHSSEDESITLSVADGD